jgi:hypothetical protein
LKNESPHAAVDRFRRKRRDLIADLAAVAAAPITSEAARALVHAEIERLATKGRPDLFGVVEHGDPIRWPMENVIAQAGVRASAPDALAVVAWLHRDALLAALDAEIAALADDGAALTDEERDVRKAEVLTSILEHERAECWLIDDLGGTVALRPDTDCRAWLGVSGPAPVERY